MIMLDNTARTESFRLGDRELPRLWNGLWQLSSNSWGTAPATKVRRYMATYADNGYVAFGMSSHSLYHIISRVLTGDIGRHGE